MSAPLISIHVDDRQVQRALDRAMQALDNPRRLMRTLANQQYGSTVRNFESESFDGESWPRLKDSTARAKIAGTRRRRGYANILRPTGRHIFQRIFQAHNETQARVYCDNPWAFVHNFGAPMPHFVMPKRTFLGFTAEDLRNIVRACRAYIVRSVLP